VAVGDDAALFVQRKTCGGGKGAVGRDADGKNDHVSLHRALVAQQHAHTGRGVLKAGDAGGKIQLHAVFAHVLVQQLGHFKVQRRHDLIGALDYGHLQSGGDQVFCGLQTDKAAAHDGGAFRALFLDHGNDGVHVGDRPQLEYFRRVHAGQVGTHRGGAGGDDQCVVALFIGFAGVGAADRDGLSFPVHGHGLAVDAHVDVVLFAHGLRSLENEGGAVFYGAADVIRQAAVGKGDILAPLQHHDIRALIQSAEPRRTAGAARHAADDDSFHMRPPDCLLLLCAA